jgi:hypothetical protein
MTWAGLVALVASGCADRDQTTTDTAPVEQGARGIVESGAHGTTVLRFGLMRPTDEPAALDGRPLTGRDGLVEVELPASAAVPDALDLAALPEGVTVRWRYADVPSDPADPLCAASHRRNHEGDVICGSRWTTETIDRDHPAAGTLDVRSLKARAPLALSLDLRAFDRGGTFCCGRARLDVAATPDARGEFPVSFADWMTATACQFDGLDEAAGAAPCPAEF